MIKRSSDQSGDRPCDASHVKGKVTLRSCDKKGSEVKENKVGAEPDRNMRHCENSTESLMHSQKLPDGERLLICVVLSKHDE